MAIPPAMLPNSCDLYRPFGAAAALQTDVPCRLAPDLARGRAPSAGAATWTHTLDVQPNVDVRDGCTRSGGGVAYADGDEVRVPTGGPVRFVVVWTEVINPGTAQAFRRAYLLRHDAAWTALDHQEAA